MFHYDSNQKHDEGEKIWKHNYPKFVVHSKCSGHKFQQQKEFISKCNICSAYSVINSISLVQIAWSYSERLLIDRGKNKSNSVYEECSGNDQHSQTDAEAFSHFNQSVNCSESTLHYLNLSTTSTATMCNSDRNNSYHTNNNYRMDAADNTTMISTSAINQCNTGSSTTNGNHRRGSLQLWQFLVALLDDSIPRYTYLIILD